MTFFSEEWTRRFDSFVQSECSRKGRKKSSGHGLPLLASLLTPHLKTSEDDQLPDVHLIFEAPSDKVGISLCAQSNMRNLGEQFKRLKTQLALQRLTRLVVIQDSRIPLTKAAKVARQSLEELQSQGAVATNPAQNVLAGLDALRDLLSDAKSGDLAFHGENVGSDVVEPKRGWRRIRPKNCVRFSRR